MKFTTVIRKVGNGKGILLKSKDLELENFKIGDTIKGELRKK